MKEGWLKIDRSVDRIFEIAIIVMFVIMLAAVVWQVIARELSIQREGWQGWTEELGRWTFVHLSYLGAAFLVKKGGHVRLDLVEQKKFIGLIGRKSHIIMVILNTGFYTTIAYAGFRLIERFGGQPSASLGISYRVLFLSIPISFLLMAVISTVHLFVHVRSMCVNIRK